MPVRRANEERGAISASRLTDGTGIPRETDRRKLALLEKREWIERTSGNAWRLVIRDEAAVARQALLELDQRTIHRIARLFAGLEALVISGEHPGKRR